MDFDKPKVYGDTFISDGLVFILTGNIRQTVFPEIMSTTGEDENDETDYLGA